MSTGKIYGTDIQTEQFNLQYPKKVLGYVMVLPFFTMICLVGVFVAWESEDRLPGTGLMLGVFLVAQLFTGPALMIPIYVTDYKSRLI